MPKVIAIINQNRIPIWEVNSSYLSIIAGKWIKREREKGDYYQKAIYPSLSYPFF